MFILHPIQKKWEHQTSKQYSGCIPVQGRNSTLLFINTNIRNVIFSVSVMLQQKILQSGPKFNMMNSSKILHHEFTVDVLMTD